MVKVSQLPRYRKADSIAEDIRQRIADGQFSAGDRLPIRTELEAAYKVSSATLQRALNDLLSEGFLESRGRQGTFVTQNPPHLTRYALLFPNNFEGSKPKNLLFRTLFDLAQDVSDDKAVVSFQGFSGRSGFLDYETLLQDVQQNRLAGLIFASSPFILKGSPLLADDGVPRTAIASQPPAPHVSAVGFDHRALFSMAASILQEKGCRRVVSLVSPALDGSILEQLEHRFAVAGLPPGRDDIIGMSINHTRWVRQLIRLLFSQPRSQQPDGLFLHDDNHLEDVTAALAELSSQAPNDLTIVTNATFPSMPVAHVPVTRIGFSIQQVLDTCMQNIDLARQSKPVPACTRIAPISLQTYHQHQVPKS